MKKTRTAVKILTVVLLAVIFTVLSVGTPTFSWFDRPNQKSGNGLEYSLSSTTFTDSNGNQGMYAYDGSDVSITEHQHSSDGVNYTPGQVLNSGTLSPGSRDYYKTTIHNDSETAQNVSFYISGLSTTSNYSTSGELAVGVNSPVKAYKDYSVLASNNNVNMTTKVSYSENPETLRVYLNPKNAWAISSDQVRVFFNPKEAWTHAFGGSASTMTITAHFGVGDGIDRTMTYYGTNAQNEPLYFVDVPSDSNYIFFHAYGKNDDYAWTESKGISLTAGQSVCLYATEQYGQRDSSGHMKLGEPSNMSTFCYTPYTNRTIDVRYRHKNNGSYEEKYGEMSYIGKDGNGDSIFYYDVDKDTTYIQFHVQGITESWSWSETINNPGFTSKQSVVFFADTVEDTALKSNNGNLKLKRSNVSGPYFLQKWNDSTKVYMRSPADLSYIKDTDYKGGAVTYRATDSNGNENTTYFTVNASSGVITPKSVGTAYLEVTIKGGTYSDTKKIRTPVQISNLVTGSVKIADVPVVTNILIPAGGDVYIHWFIMNDKNAASSVSYSLDGVYLGL